MRVCPRYGEVTPDRARFCLTCSAPLAEDRRRERPPFVACDAQLFVPEADAELAD
jgi:hypothetical protein